MSTFDSNFESSLRKSNGPILTTPDFNSYRTGPVFEAPQTNSYPENLHVLNLPKFDELKTGALYETQSPKVTTDSLPKVVIVDSGRQVPRRHAYSTLESEAYEHGGEAAVEAVQRQTQSIRHTVKHTRVQHVAHKYATETHRVANHTADTDHHKDATKTEHHDGLIKTTANNMRQEAEQHPAEVALAVGMGALFAKRYPQAAAALLGMSAIAAGFGPVGEYCAKQFEGLQKGWNAFSKETSKANDQASKHISKEIFG